MKFSKPVTIKPANPVPDANLIIEHREPYWPQRDGSPASKVCSSLADIGPEQYAEFHDAAHPVVWKVTKHKGAKHYRSFWCDAHLPEEYREIEGE